MPTVGNGNLATVVFRDRIFMNGLYNGEGNKSHRAAVPALNCIQMKPAADQTSELFSLNCIEGDKQIYYNKILLTVRIL